MEYKWNPKGKELKRKEKKREEKRGKERRRSEKKRNRIPVCDGGDGIEKFFVFSGMAQQFTYAAMSAIIEEKLPICRTVYRTTL